MKAIAVLFTSFLALCAYLEHKPEFGLVSYGIEAPKRVVKRIYVAPQLAMNSPSPLRENVQPAKKVGLPKLPPLFSKPLRNLDLSLPHRISQITAKAPASHRLVLEPVNRRDTIRYRAELLFDREEGSSIRGGKVDIEIPLG